MTPKIMIVEDDRVQAMSVKKTLQANGYKDVILFHDAPSAIGHIKRNGDDSADIALVDLILDEDKDGGFNVANTLRDHCPIPTIFWSGHPDIEELENNKSYAFIQKNAHDNTLLYTMNQALHNYDDFDHQKAVKYTYLKQTYGKDKAWEKVAISDIIFIETNKGYLDFYTEEKVYRAVEKKSLKRYENEELYPTLYRIHNKTILNTESRRFKRYFKEYAVVELPSDYTSKKYDTQIIHLSIAEDRYTPFKHFTRPDDKPKTV